MPFSYACPLGGHMERNVASARSPDADTIVSLTTLSFSPKTMSLGRVGVALLTSEMISPGWMTPLMMLPLPSVMLVTCECLRRKLSTGSFFFGQIGDIKTDKE